MIDFTIKKGDRLPAIKFSLKEKDGSAMNLANCSIVFNYSLKASGSTVVSRTVLIEDASLGTAQYEWVAADTDTVGVYQGELVITFNSGRELTLPANGYIIYEIVDDIS